MRQRPKYNHFTLRGCLGFSLVELIIALVIGGILFALAMPNLRVLVQNDDIAAETNTLVADLNLARSEAIRRVIPVAVCKSSNPGDTSPGCISSGNDWAIGRIIFIDTNRNGTIDTGEPILRTSAGTRRDITIRGGTNVKNAIVFTPEGATTLAAPSDPTIPSENQFKICNQQRGASAGRVITVNAIGRISADRSPSNCG